MAQSTNPTLAKMGAKILSTAKSMHTFNTAKTELEQKVTFNNALTSLTDLGNTSTKGMDRKEKYNFYTKAAEQAKELKAEAPKGMGQQAEALYQLYSGKAKQFETTLQDAMTYSVELFKSGKTIEEISEWLDRTGLSQKGIDRVFKEIDKLKKKEKDKMSMYTKMMEQQNIANPFFDEDQQVWNSMVNIAKEFPESVGPGILSVAKNIDKGWVKNQSIPFSDWRGINDKEAISKQFLDSLQQNEHLSKWFDSWIKKHRDDVGFIGTESIFDKNPDDIADILIDTLGNKKFIKDFKNFAKTL
jgi:ribosomal protein L16 Arg81 hydroxylase